MMDNAAIEITGFYASLLAVCYLYLSALVISARRSAKVSLGDGGDASLQQLSRAHGNFAEYVPITLILALCLEINTDFDLVVHIACVALLFGRLTHAYGLRHHIGASWQRVVGMLSTFAAIVLLSAFNLVWLYF
ncbi:MAPEG family protein [Alteromonas facilis]|uniref:MAPEG family protein n=1 Tax=Alteromonas facilis TaxID=2048004 RepID=UPI001F0C0665|nr:MAPEG family protein [Alteromonas facilis]